MAAGYTMTIDGKSVKGSKSTGVINPATGKIFAEVPDCSKAELDQAMSAAQKAFPSWSKDVNARRKVLQDCAAALQQPVAHGPMLQSFIQLLRQGVPGQRHDRFQIR